MVKVEDQEKMATVNRKLMTEEQGTIRAKMTLRNCVFFVLKDYWKQFMSPVVQWFGYALRYRASVCDPQWRQKR